MNIVEILLDKRDGKELTPQQIRFFIESYTAGTITDEQASALLMAVFFQGMTSAELNEWTKAMIESGERLDLSSLKQPTVDKHSTGGVGDKVSLILVPLVAACGAAVPQLSGRGLGHTGGTLDKLESIQGFNVNLTNDQAISQLDEIGGVICAASENLAPADKKLYALRDVTATVESIPLISSSIMSKKIAEGTQSLVLDVKVGSGAFMKELAPATTLAETMVGLGTDSGVKTSAILTDMESPLGLTAGNAIEVEETLEALAGGGPPDLREITLALAEEMLDLAGINADPAAALDSGKAMDSWNKIISAQGGDPSAPLPKAKEIETLTADAFGKDAFQNSKKGTAYLASLDAYALGMAAWRLGAGRAKKGDAVSFGAGVRWLAKPGDELKGSSPLIELHTDEPERMESAKALLFEGITLGKKPPKAGPLILKKIRG